MDTFIEDNGRFEWIDVRHDPCNGQGCGGCKHSGVEWVRVDVTAG
ncbi:hypothetical protein [Nocardia wallacei]|nr:hypothetical protein [Nocardia wallacei]